MPGSGASAPPLLDEVDDVVLLLLLLLDGRVFCQCPRGATYWIWYRPYATRGLIAAGVDPTSWFRPAPLAA
jgi:hypothetical protein